MYSESLFESFGRGLGVLVVLGSVIIFISLVYVVVALVSIILECIQLNKFAKAHGLKCAQYAWIPYVGRTVYGEVRNRLYANKSEFQEKGLFIGGIVAVSVTVLNIMVIGTLNILLFLSGIFLLVTTIMVANDLKIVSGRNVTLVCQAVLGLFGFQGFHIKKTLTELDAIIKEAKANGKYDTRGLVFGCDREKVVFNQENNNNNFNNDDKMN